MFANKNELKKSKSVDGSDLTSFQMQVNIFLNNKLKEKGAV